MERTRRLAGRRERWLAALALALFAAAGLALVRQARDPATANHDVAWLLYAGGRLLEGDRYGVDVIEHNPPLAIWISLPAVSIARASGAPVLAVYNLLVLALVLASSGALLATLRRGLEEPLLANAAALLLACTSVAVASYSFGQRDHLIFLLLAPALCLAARAADDPKPSRTARVLCGLCIAAAIGLKPHYALVWLGVELARARVDGILRSAWRLENAVAGLSLALYAGGVAAFAPHYFEAARDAFELYDAYDARARWLIRPARTLPLIAAGIALVALRPAGLVGRCARLSAVAAALSLAVVVWQGKGFGYHHLPSQLFGLLSLVFSVSAAADAGRPRPIAIAWLAAACAGTALVASGWLDLRFPQHRAFARFLSERAPAESVLFFVHTVDPTFPVVTLTGSRSASPYSALWQIAGHYSQDELSGERFPYRQLDAMGERERRYVTNLVDRMLRLRPRLLFFDRSPRKWTFGASRFDFDRYFAADPRFPALLAGYRHAGAIGAFEVCVPAEDAAPGSRPCGQPAR